MLNIGHRGAMGHAPENTLSSFQKALDIGVDAIELDVHVCKSGELVVIHDMKLNRTTNGEGYVQDKTLEELKLYDAGNGEKIPMLEEVIELVNKAVPINIELKGHGTSYPVSMLIHQYVRKGWSYDDFLVSSFNHVELFMFKQLAREVKIGALTEGIPLGYSDFALKLDAYSINIASGFVHEEFVKHAHDNGFKVFVYTANDQDDIERVEKMGVDGVFTDFPDRLK